MKEKIDEKNQLILKYLKMHDERGLELLLNEYGSTIKTIVWHHLRCMPLEDREECIDDTFLDIWNNIEAYDAKKGNLKGWICSVAKYNSFDYIRKYIKYVETESIYEHDNVEDARSELMYLESELKDELRELMGALSTEECKMVESYYIYGYSFKEIASWYEISEQAAYKRVARAIKKMSKLRKGK